MSVTEELLHRRVLVTGGRGLVGSALIRALERMGCRHVLAPSSQDVDLRKFRGVQSLFEAHRPEYVFMLAARVGGIKANNDRPVEFLADNMAIELNLFKACHEFQVKKSLFLGSSCIYPRECPQPMREEYLMSGPLEPTNEGYAMAKLAGLTLAKFYAREYGMNTVCPVPCNIYGPGDTFDLNRSHVLSALVRRFVDAVDANLSEVVLWGTGRPKREFIHVDDVASGMLLLFEKVNDPRPVNLGPGTDIGIHDLAQMISGYTGFSGAIRWDARMPDGMPRKCLDVSRLREIGFRAQVSLEQGIPQVIDEYRTRKARGEIDEQHP